MSFALLRYKNLPLLSCSFTAAFYLVRLMVLLFSSKQPLLSAFVCWNIVLWCNSVSVPREESRRPQPGPAAVASPSSQSVRCMVEEPRAGSQISPNQLRKVRQGQRRRRPTCPLQSWISQRKPNSVTSEFPICVQ